MKRVQSLNHQLTTARKGHLSLKELAVKATESMKPEEQPEIVRVIQTKRGPKVVRESSMALSSRTLETQPYSGALRTNRTEAGKSEDHLPLSSRLDASASAMSRKSSVETVGHKRPSFLKVPSTQILLTRNDSVQTFGYRRQMDESSLGGNNNYSRTEFRSQSQEGIEQPIKIFNASLVKERSIEDMTRKPLRQLLQERRLKERSNPNSITV